MKALGALALVVSLVASAEQPLPTYPGTVHTRIGSDLLISGEHYRLAYFHSGDSLEQIARYFSTQWTAQGYPVTADGDFKQAGIVSAFYTREGLIRSVVLTRHQGKTLGFTVLKDLWVREDLAQAVKLPRLEGSVFSQELVLREQAGGIQARSGLLELSIDQARDRLVKSFEDKGYVMVRDTKVKREGSASRVIELSRGAEQAVVSLVQVEPNLVAVQQTWVGSDRLDAVPNDEALKAARQ